jgi:hypothetical protein
MNKKSAARKSVISLRLGLSFSAAAEVAALMAATIEALLRPPTPAMNTSFGSEPWISRRTS